VRVTRFEALDLPLEFVARDRSLPGRIHEIPVQCKSPESLRSRLARTASFALKAVHHAVATRPQARGLGRLAAFQATSRHLEDAQRDLYGCYRPAHMNVECVVRCNGVACNVSADRSAAGLRLGIRAPFHSRDSMSSLPEPDKEAVRHERAMISLCDRTGAPLAEVRSLFAQEFSRLELGAKVRSYLAVLTTSNVRAMLRRKSA
jgi:hypothetical protein